MTRTGRHKQFQLSRKLTAWFVLFLLFISFIYSIPMILSTNWAKDYIIIPTLQNRLKGQVQIEEIQLQWWASQKIDHFVWVDSDRNKRVSFDELTFALPLYQLFFKKPPIQDIAIHKLAISEKDNHYLSNLNGSLHIAENTIQIQIEGKTSSQGKDGFIHASGDLPLLNILDLLKRKIRFPVDRIKSEQFTFEIQDFPTELLRHFDPYPLITLSDILGQHVSASGNLVNRSAVVAIASETLKGKVHFHLDSEGIQLDASDQIIYYPPTSLLAKLSDSYGAEISTMPLYLTFSSLETSSLQFVTEKIGIKRNVQLENVKGSLLLDRDTDRLAIKYQGIISVSGIHGNVEGNASTSLSMDAEVLASMKGRSIPTSIIKEIDKNHVLYSHPFLLASLGPTSDIYVGLTSGKKQSTVDLELQSESFHLPRSTFLIKNEEITLLEPVNIDLLFSADTYYHATEYLENRPIAKDIPLTIQITTLQGKLPFLSESFTPDELKVAATISSPSASLMNIPLVGTAELKDVLLEVSGANCSNLTVQAITKVALQPEKEYRISLKGNGSLNDQWQFQLNEMQVKSDSQNLELDILGKKKKGGQRLCFDGKVSYELTEKDLIGLRAKILHPATLSVTFQEVEIDRINRRRPSLTGKGEVFIDELLVGQNSQKRHVSVQELLATWSINSDENRANFTFNTNTEDYEKNTKGSATAAIEIKQLFSEGSLNWHNWQLKTEAHLNSFPTHLLSLLSGSEDWNILLGDTIDASFLAEDLNQGNNGLVTLALMGEKMEIGGVATIDSNLVLENASKPLDIKFELTPKRFALLSNYVGNENLMSQNLLKLQNSGHINIEVSDVILPLRNILHTSFQLNVEASDLIAKESGSEDLLFIDQAKAFIQSEDLAKDIQFSTSITGQLVENESETIQLDYQGRVENIFNENGNLSWRNCAVHVSGTTTQVPVVFLCGVFGLDEKVYTQASSLLGYRLNSKVEVHMDHLNGSIETHLRGTHGELSLDGMVQEGTLTLNSPLHTQFNLSTTLTDSILDELMPLLRSAHSSESSIKITIGAEGFSYPLWGGTWSDINAEHIRIDLGKIYFNLDQQIAEILSILKFHTDREFINVWFTPLYISYRNGKAHINRMDMLVADLYPMAIWGDIDFVEDSVKMKVGLGGNTLKRAFGLKGVPKDYYLHLSLKGTTSDARLDVGKATTKLAAFIAQLRGGPQGIIVGGIMDLIGGTFGNKPTPPPTTQPLPWD